MVYVIVTYHNNSWNTKLYTEIKSLMEMNRVKILTQKYQNKKQ